jgi:6-phosphogluconate dehydrogenase (decarboxylating)
MLAVRCRMPESLVYVGDCIIDGTQSERADAARRESKEIIIDIWFVTATAFNMRRGRKVGACVRPMLVGQQVTLVLIFDRTNQQGAPDAGYLRLCKKLFEGRKQE